MGIPAVSNGTKNSGDKTGGFPISIGPRENTSINVPCILQLFSQMFPIKCNQIHTNPHRQPDEGDLQEEFQLDLCRILLVLG